MKNNVGRPKSSFKYDNNFYLSIVEEHKELSLSQMANKYGVSVSSIVKWIAKGKGVLNEQFESK